MAEQKSILVYTGRFGESSGFRRNNKFYIRSRPDSIHHTPNMKRSAARFGRASSTGAFIRKALDIKGDGGHVNRFTKALIPSAGADIHKLAGVCFNKTQRTHTYFSTSPVLRKNGDVYIPAQTFKKSRRNLTIRVTALRIDVQTRKVLGKNTHTLEIDTSTQFYGATLSARVPGTGTLIIAFSVNDSAEIMTIKETQIACELPSREIDIRYNASSIITAFIQRE